MMEKKRNVFSLVSLKKLQMDYHRRQKKLSWTFARIFFLRIQLKILRFYKITQKRLLMKGTIKIICWTSPSILLVCQYSIARTTPLMTSHQANWQPIILASSFNFDTSLKKNSLITLGCLSFWSFFYLSIF